MVQLSIIAGTRDGSNTTMEAMASSIIIVIIIIFFTPK
jgi:hypothetical protein